MTPVQGIAQGAQERFIAHRAQGVRRLKAQRLVRSQPEDAVQALEGAGRRRLAALLAQQVVKVHDLGGVDGPAHDAPRLATLKVMQQESLFDLTHRDHAGLVAIE